MSPADVPNINDEPEKSQLKGVSPP